MKKSLIRTDNIVLPCLALLSLPSPPLPPPPSFLLSCLYYTEETELLGLN